MNSTPNPGRGPTVLVLGILSIVLCAPLGPFAWVMGAKDLKRISAGEIVPEARGTTQAGMICGIIGSVLFVVGLIWGAVVAAAVIAAAVGQAS